MKNNTKGNSLIFVISMMFVLLTTSLFLVNMITNNIRSANSFLNFTQAVYASESGIERTLFLQNKEHLKLNSIVKSEYKNGLLNNNSSFLIDKEYKVFDNIESNKLELLAIDETYNINITDIIGDLKSIKLNFNTANTGDDPTITISVKETKNGAEKIVYYNHLTKNNNNGVIANIDIDYNDNASYLLEFKSFYSDLNNITFDFYSEENSNGNKLNINSSEQSIIKSTGNYKKNNKTLYSSYMIDNNFK